MLFAAIIGCLAPGVAWGQRTSAQTRAVVPTPPVAVWDSLYASHQYFTLDDALRQWSGPMTPTVQYMQGVVAHAFNNPDAAIIALKPLLDSVPASLTRSQLRWAVDALGASYRTVYRYRESADVYRIALRRRIAVDSATRSLWRRHMELNDALRDVLPQHVTWSREARQDTLPNDGIRYAARGHIHGTPISRPLRFDLRAPWTVLDSTSATRHAVRFLGHTMTTRSPDGTSVVARVGIIPSLMLGPVTLSNVVVVVIADRDLMASQNSGTDSVTAPIAGIIGVSVMNAIGRVTFMRDGHIGLSSPGVMLHRTISDRFGTRDMRATPADTVARRIAFVASAYDTIIAELPSGNESAIRVLHDDPFRALLPRDVQIIDQGSVRERAENSSVEATAVTLDFAAMTLWPHLPQPPPTLPTITYPAEAPPAPVSTDSATLPEDLAFVALLFALFVIPKALQRYRIPSAITSLIMGAVASSFGLFQHDPTLHLLSTFGIVALFLFAGLEINGPELRRNTSTLLWHGALWGVLVVVTATVASFGFGVEPRPSALIALALMTPSTGFILSSLGGFGLHQGEQMAVKSYAIGSELLALGVLFFVLQATSVEQLAFSLAAMIGVIIVIPLAFRFFAAVVAPHAPRSEFAFLLMVAVVSAYATRRLGVYYLVGAFLVGVAAQRFRSDHPAMSSEKMVDALESFGSVFIPFYFFRAGTQIVSDQLTSTAIGLGLLLVLICVPVRIGLIALQRRRAFGESFKVAHRIGSALVPTLVFTLVITEILHTQFGLPDTIAGALVLYTILNTVVPAFVLHGAPPEFEHVEATPVRGLLPNGMSSNSRDG